MRETHVDGFKSGSWWEVCPRCGFDVRAEKMAEEEETGRRVCTERCIDEHSKTTSAGNRRT